MQRWNGSLRALLFIDTRVAIGSPLESSGKHSYLCPALRFRPVLARRWASILGTVSGMMPDSGNHEACSGEYPFQRMRFSMSVLAFA